MLTAFAVSALVVSLGTHLDTRFLVGVFGVLFAATCFALALTYYRIGGLSTPRRVEWNVALL